MADLTDIVGNQMLKLQGNLIKSTGEFLNELLELLSKNAIDDPNKVTIMKHIDKGGEVYTSTVKNEFIKDLESHLMEQGVAYFFMDLGDNDDSKMLVIRDIDRERAEYATKMVLSEKSQLCEFSRDEFINMVPRAELSCVSGLSLHEYELFRDMAKNNNLQFAATISEDNKVNLLYSVQAHEKMTMALKQMSWNLTGRNGDEFEAVYKTRAEAQAVIKRAYNKKESQKADPVYLVDAKNPNQVIRIDKEGIALCAHYDHDLTRDVNFQDESVIMISYSDKKFAARGSELIAQLGEPVVITPTEMRNAEKIIARKLPKVDKEWQEKEEGFREQFDMKLDSKDDYMLDEMHAYDENFSFTSIVEEEIVFDKEEWKPNDKEKEEIDEHVRDAIMRVKTYQFHQPQTKQLTQLIEAAKRKKTYERAKSDVEREERDNYRKNARNNKKKEDYRDK